MKYFIFTLLLLIEIIDGKKLPKYIKACGQKDPKLNECFMKNGNLAMSYIARGDPNYEINTLLPLNFTDYIYVEVPTNPPLKLSLTNITTYGAENFKIINPNINLEQKIIQFTLVNPSVIWKQNYHASIDIDNIKHEVEGRGQLEFVNGEFLMTYNYDLYLVDGIKHAKIINGSIEFVNYELIFDLENLASNKIIKKYFKKAHKYFVNDEVKEKCSEIVGEYIAKIFKHVPFDLIFIP